MVAATALVCASAEAATYSVHLEGKLTSQINPGTDPTLSAGNTVVLEMGFNDQHVFAWGSAGFSIASGFMSIIAPGVEWTSNDDLIDGWPFFAYTNDDPEGPFVLRFPAIAFKDGKVVGVLGDLYPLDDRPLFLPGSATSVDSFLTEERDEDGNLIVSSYYGPVELSAAFQIQEGYGNYGNTNRSPGFNGIWDFAGSSVTLDGVPEPASWAMMLVGFGLAGTAIRLRHRAKAECRLLMSRRQGIA